MFKRIRWPGWIVIFLLFFAIITTITKGSEAIIKTDKEDEDNIRIEHKKSSKYPGLNFITETKEENTYTSSISIPTTESESINKEIEGWLNKQKDDFFSAMAANEDILGEDFRAHLNIQLDTEKVNKDIYNLTFYAYHFSGGANGINIIKSFTVDLNEKEILSLTDILEFKEDGLKIVQENIKEQLMNNEDVNKYIMIDTLNDVLSDPNDWEWAINNEIFTIYFSEYEIAAGAAGVIEVNIPLAEIKDYLKEDILSQLDIVTDPVAEEDSKEKQEEKEKKEEDQEDKEEKVELDPSGKYVALTFDDGPSSTVTPNVLGTLKEYGARATFYMLGSQVNYYPEIAKQVAEAGHEIGNHTENHIDLTVADRSKVHAEIKDSSDKIFKASGQQPTTVRPPYGAFNDNVIEVSKENNQSIILWSVDSLDWKSRDASAVKQEILRNVIPGSIVLMHDIHNSTADALPGLLKELKEQGYEFITVSELLSLQEAAGVGPHYGTLNY